MENKNQFFLKILAGIFIFIAGLLFLPSQTEAAYKINYDGTSFVVDSLNVTVEWNAIGCGHYTLPYFTLNGSIMQYDWYDYCIGWVIDECKTCAYYDEWGGCAYYNYDWICVANKVKSETLSFSANLVVGQNSFGMHSNNNQCDDCSCWTVGYVCDGVYAKITFSNGQVLYTGTNWDAYGKQVIDISGCGYPRYIQSTTCGDCCQTDVRKFITVEALPPSPPTGLSASCPSPGTTGKVSWNAVPGATYYPLRVNNTADGWDGSCSSAGGDFCKDVYSTSYTFSSKPGATYSWWLHSCNAAGCNWTTVMGPNFTCGCYSLAFQGGSISPSSVNAGGSYTMSCNYGAVVDCIAPTPPSGSCVFTGFTGTVANFSCTAGSTAGPFTGYCKTFTGSVSNCCSYNNSVGTLTVISPCTCSSWSNQGCGLGGCAATQMYRTRSCNPSGCASQSQCVADASCVMASTYGLSVSKSGTGSGTVSFNPPSSTFYYSLPHQENYNSGTVVTLTPKADTGSTFAGWSPTGFADCLDGVVTMNAPLICNAIFNTTVINQAPVAVATISKDGTTYADSITVTQGVATPIYLSAAGSSDPNGWTDTTNGVSSGGKCEWNSNLNQGAPVFEGPPAVPSLPIINPGSAAACNIGPLRPDGTWGAGATLTFNDSPGTYTYQVLRITDKPGLQSNVDTVTVTVQAPLCTCSSWSSQGCGLGGCAATEMYQTRSCNPAGCASQSQCMATAVCASPATTTPATTTPPNLPEWIEIPPF